MVTHAWYVGDTQSPLRTRQSTHKHSLRSLYLSINMSCAPGPQSFQEKQGFSLSHSASTIHAIMSASRLVCSGVNSMRVGGFCPVVL